MSVALGVLTSAVGTSAKAGDADIQSRIYLDIPAQPLAAALEAYCAAAGIQMFVDTGSIAGRRSWAVQGEFNRASALHSLLAGTGLAARFVGDRGFTLAPLPGAEADIDPAKQDSLENRRFSGYSAVLQAGLRKALCRSEDTRPGAYRFLGRLWIDALGMVSRAEIITSTGSDARDAALLKALQGGAIGETPPPDLPQPVTLLLTADATVAAEYCAGSKPDFRSIRSAAGMRH